jgi:predicted RNase H-like nuclease
MLLKEFRAIHHRLEQTFGPSALKLPDADVVRGPRRLKPYEDVLDALVCAWVGVRFFRNAAIAFGDATAAIGCPIASRG